MKFSKLVAFFALKTSSYFLKSDFLKYAIFKKYTYQYQHHELF